MKYKVGESVLTDLDAADVMQVSHTGITNSMTKNNNLIFKIKTTSNHTTEGYPEYRLEGSECWWAESMLQRVTEEDEKTKDRKRVVNFFNLRS